MVPIYNLKSIREAATRNEFYNFLSVGLKALLFGAYRETKTTYQNLVTFETSDKDKEGYPALGMPGLPTKVLEGQPYSAKNLPKEDTVEITNYKFGEIIEITEELIEDDKTGKIKSLPTGLGKAHAKFEDKSVYEIINNNATCYDSQNLFSMSHPVYTGGGAVAANDNIYTNVTFSAGSLAVVLGKISRWSGHTSEDILDVVAKNLVVPENLRYTAGVLTQSEFIPYGYAAGTYGPATTGGAPGKNVVRELGLGTIASPRLDATNTLDWYVWTDFPMIVFQWRKKLQVLAENPNSGEKFLRDVMRWKSKVRFGLKAINWRGGIKVS